MSQQPPGSDPTGDPEGVPAPEPATPPQPPPAPEPDVDTTRVPWESAAPTPPPPADPGWAAPPPPQSPPGIPPPGPGGAGGSVLWATPTSAATHEVPGAPGLSFADSASRVVAFILDSVLVAIIASIIAGLLGFGTTTSSATGANFQVQGAAFAIPSAIVGLVYFVFFWTGGRRATPGQMLFKLQVGNAFDGQALTPTQAVKRWFAFGSWLGVLAVVPALYSLGSLAQLVWSIVLLVSTVRSPTKQGLHDKFANSAVVRPSGQSNGVASACLVIGVVVLLLLVFSVVALIFLGSQVSNILSTVGDSI